MKKSAKISLIRFISVPFFNMPTENNTTCPRCQQTFICDPINIADCDCTKIQLSAEEISYIAKHYSNCVCNTCLLHLKDEILAQK
jgi:hypothetical protein